MPKQARRPRRSSAAAAATRRHVKRDPTFTRERLLQAAVTEFCGNGFNGARVERIVRTAKSNPRMLYHYFGSKSGLYVAVLERCYGELRALERALKLNDLPPVEGMRRLMDFTFDHFGNHPGLIHLINNENLLRARFLRQSLGIRAMTSPLVAAIRDLLRRGERDGSFRRGIDPIQLYVSITALSFFHVSNCHTLSALFEADLAAPAWIAARREHAREMLLAYLRPPAAARAAERSGAALALAQA